MPTAFAPAERATADEVQRQHRKLQALPFVCDFLDAMPNLAVVLNADRQIVLMNRAFRDFLGAGDPDSDANAQRREVFEALVASALGKRPGEAVGCIHAAETDGGCGTTKFCRNCGAARAIVNSQKWHGLDVQECRLTVGDGDRVETSVDFRVWAQSLDVDGEWFTVFSLIDISHEKRREALERIFYHDVMNTASGVQGLSEMMAQGQLPTEGIREAAGIMSQSAEQLVEEIDAQRALSAAESGDLEVTPRVVRSMELIRRVLNVMRTAIVSKGRELHVDSATQPFDFTSDPVLLRRVLVNLVKNAIEAVPAGGIVTVGARREPDAVVFTVHNATVMPADVQQQVFQRSYSTKGAGRGLGTYSIRLLTRHYLGGQVSFVSNEAEGTVFTVRLPRLLAPVI
ncbi:MAG: HAMP domain-containing sensor histidine kinase [Gemmatimonadaceae bacterium]|nr:HAMP domain-containing sensor histidine kinase [Gemmatimonadaceae bacterium]